jgi:uncharacterized protein
LADDFDRSIVKETAHRPWTMPSRPWVMTQTWNDLLFIHWPVAPGAVRDQVPAHFALDLFDGAAWIGIVPFYMTNVAPRGVPSLPWVSRFPELNVRTYVRVDNRPGIYFFSLDAGSALAVLAARSLLNLPYYTASMTVTTDSTTIGYRSRRKTSTASGAFGASYRPAGLACEPSPGSLEHFLTERYCLYHVNHRGRPYRLEIHHPPWQLQPAHADVSVNTMAVANGIALPNVTPLLHYVKRQDAVAWMPTRLT